MSDKVAAELVARCFAARTHAHILHLATESFAEHSALATFYEEIVDLADSFAEVYNGLYNTRLKVPFETVRPNVCCRKLVDALCEWIDKNRDQIGKPEDTQLQNIIDEIHQLVNQTQYRLTLK